MAEKKTVQHKVVNAAGTEAKAKKPASTTTASGHKVNNAAPVGNATGWRIGAICFWLAAVGFEVCAILVYNGILDLKFIPALAQLIIFLVLDLICVIVGSQFWKKANHISPASKKNKVKFWLWNNMGVIVAAFAFIPFIILALTSKNADKKTKTIATVAAVVALLIAGTASIDYNPISIEEKEAAEQVITTDVYWAPFGRVYHTHEDCSALNRTETLTVGNVDEAIAAGRTRLCSFCAKKDAIDTSNLLTDGRDAEDIADAEGEAVDEEVEEEEESKE